MPVLRTRVAVVGTGVTATGDGTTTDQVTFGSNVATDPTPITFVRTQASANSLAAYLANTGGADVPLVRIMLDNDSTFRAMQIREVELNQRVSATENITGTALDCFVEQVTHRITNGGLKHECELVVSGRTRMVGIYSPGDQPAGAAVYALSAYVADNPAEPPPYATYGF